MAKADAAAVIVKTNLTEAEQIAAMAKYNLTEAEVKQTLASARASAANATETTTTSFLTAAKVKLTTVTKGLWAVMKAHPLITILSIASLLIPLIKAIVENIKSTSEKISELNTQFEEASSKIKEISTNFRDLKSSADSIIPRFTELSKGVDRFGNNISLTDEEYAEFISLSNQIAEIFPELCTGMDENGNAMLSLALDADTLAESFERLIEAERKAANEEIANTLPDVIENRKQIQNQYEKQQKRFEQQYDTFIEKYKNYQNAYSDATIRAYKNSYGDDWSTQLNASTEIIAKEIYDNLQPIFEEARNSDLWSKLPNMYASSDGIVDWNALINSPEVDMALDRVRDKIEAFDEQIENAWNAINPVITAYIQTEFDYNELDSDLQQVALSMAHSLDYGSPKLDTQSEIENYISDEILEPLKNATPEVQNAFSDLLNLSSKSSELSVLDYNKEVNRLVSFIETESQGKFDSAFIKESLGYSQELNKLANYITEISKTIGDSSSLTPLGFEDSELWQLSPDKITEAYDLVRNYGIKSWDELSRHINEETFKLSFNLDTEKTNFENLSSAFSESLSATGLSTESIKALKERYEEFEGYDAAELFEETANGIHLNVDALNELESAYEKQNKADIDKKLTGLTEQYEKLTDEINNASDATKTGELFAQRANILAEITATAQLASQYDGLTSAYNKWKRAQSTTNERDMYENIQSNFENVRDLISRGWAGSDDVRTFVDLLSSEDLSTAPVEDIIAAWDKLGQKIGGTKFTVFDFFTTDEDGNSTAQGLINFFDTVNAVLGDEYAKLEDGAYHFDFGELGDEGVAKALGMDVEALQAILRAGIDAGMDIEITTDYSSLDDAMLDVEKANERLKELGKTDYTFNFGTTDIDYVNRQIDEAKGMLEKFYDTDGNVIDTEGLTEAQGILATLIYQKQSLDTSVILSVDTAGAKESTKEAINTLLGFKTAYNEYEVKAALGVDTTEAKANMQSFLSEISGWDDSVKNSLGLQNINVEIGATLDDSQIEGAIQSISAIDEYAILEVFPDASLVTDFQKDEHTAPGTVIWDNNIRKVTAWINSDLTRPGYVKWQNVTDYVKTTFNATGTTSSAKGNFKAGKAGVTGTAFSSGNWGASNSGVALGGELGEELLVRDGKYYTIGSESAEFFKYKKGDIIFNAEQTKEIFEKGKISSANPRGKAFNLGTANQKKNLFTTTTVKQEGSSKSNPLTNIANTVSTAIKKETSKIVSGGSGGGRIYTSKVTTDDGDSNSSGGKATNKSNGSTRSNSSKSTSGSSSSSSSGDKEAFDWIAVAIERIEQAIGRLKTVAESTYKTLKTRLNATYDEIAKVNEQIALEQQAYTRYMKEANSVGLSSDLKTKIQNGTIDITKYDEATQEKITEYQNWYEKAQESSDRIQTLHEDMASLYEDNFNNIQTDFENQISMLERTENIYNSRIDELEARGYLESTKAYDALSGVTRDRIGILNQELSSLEDSLAEAMASGEIEEGSEAWYSMQLAISDVKDQIDEANVSLLEFEKTSREVQWGHFDYLQDRISQITKESDFLIDLMSNSDLYDDKGKFTDTGTATMGLHAQNYNVYMAQSEMYADELADLDRQIAEDPYNTDLIKRREELLELQQESILAAEDEKQAIVDMVEEGIKLELESLQELMDAYKDSLDSAKDLYEYQKQIEDQTSNISNLRKQLAAYEGDNSEENRARIQQIKVDLEEAETDLKEAEYDKYISDQKALLDDLYLEYEEVLNQRLDDTNKLISDMITNANTNAASINTTLTTAADSVGYSLSDNLKAIWDGSTDAVDGALSPFGEGFSGKLTSINTVLTSIATYVSQMITESDNISENGSNGNNTETGNGNGNNGGVQKPPAEQKLPVVNQKPTTQSNEIKVGGKINAGSAKIYDYAGDKSGENQYYKNDPVYVVLEEKNGWLKVRHHKEAKGVSGWFKKSDIKAYKTGGIVDYTGLAQVHGSVTRPETFLNADDTEKFVELTNTLKRMAKQELTFGNLNSYATDKIAHYSIGANTSKLLSAVATQESKNSSNTFGDIHITIPIDHVEDYNDFVNKLRDDKRFEDMIHSMTFDKVTKRGSMTKNKYTWK